MSELIIRHTQDEMLSSLAAYLPGGELFESAYIPGTNFNALLAGLSGELLSAENFMFLYNSQFIPDDTTVFIEEWESAVGIPDDCFSIDETDTNEERRLNILVKLASLGVQTAADFENLALILGFTNVEVVPGVGSDNNSIINGTFSVDTDWTKGTGWTISGGTANHVPGSASNLSQDISAITGMLYAVTYEVSNLITGTVTPNIGGTDGVTRTADGFYEEVIEAGDVFPLLFPIPFRTDDPLFSMVADASFDGSVDNITVRGSATGGLTPRFTIVVKFIGFDVPLFPLDFPIVFGDPILGILVCLFTKLKPANCDIVFINIDTFDYLALGHQGSPFITIYKRNDDVFTKLANPSTLPTGFSLGVTFSPSNIYLAVAHASSPFVTIYKRDGDVFNKLANPTTTPTGTGDGVAFSASELYLAVGHDNSPFVTIYKRSGDVFNKLPNPSTLPTGNGDGVAFSPDGVYLAVGHSNSPFVTIYKRNADVFTKLPNPTTLPGGESQEVAFSPDSVFLAVAHLNSPFLTIYKRDGDDFNKLPNPVDLPTGNGDGVAFSSDGLFLAVAHANSPFITIYKIEGDVFTKLDDPTVLPGGNGTDVSFSTDALYLAVSLFPSPFLAIYKRSGDVFTKIANPDTVPTQFAAGVSFSGLLSDSA